MGCVYHQDCGGCENRELSLSEYQKYKERQIWTFLEKNLGDLSKVWQKPVFLPDGSRRRAAFAFESKNRKLCLGFNENRSNRIVDVSRCLMLTDKINTSLAPIKSFLQELCSVVVSKKVKGKKIEHKSILSGDLLVLEAENGLDFVLETSEDLELDHRMCISDFMSQSTDFIRFSWRKKHAYEAEPVYQEAKPFIKIGKTDVFVAPGDFLQPSSQGEKTLTELVLKYVGQTRGKMADLFCGIGTFSYALAELENTNIASFDVSKSLLKGFQASINAQMIQNIKIYEKNLFLYPLTADELKEFDVIVFDPPRAGAAAQVKEICQISNDGKNRKIIAVSCNPETFARDAKLLISAGFELKSITAVDQFVYSSHSEIVALFTNEK